MTIDEFMQVSDLIPSFYDGKGRLNSYQMEIWFEELHGYSKEKYERALKLIFKSSQYVPGLAKVLETIRTVKEDEEVKEKVDCKLCRSSGYIIQWRTIDDIQYPFVLKCSCANSKGLDYDGTKIKDKEHRSKFYLETAEKYYSDVVKEKTNEANRNNKIDELTGANQVAI